MGGTLKREKTSHRGCQSYSKERDFKSENRRGWYWNIALDWDWDLGWDKVFALHLCTVLSSYFLSFTMTYSQSHSHLLMMTSFSRNRPVQ